jgi:hypothetical protein
MTTDHNIPQKDKALRVVMQRIGEQAEKAKLSEDFTDRLMERIRREESAKKMAIRRRRVAFAIGIAAALALLVGVALHVMHKDVHNPQQATAKNDDAKVVNVKDWVEDNIEPVAEHAERIPRKRVGNPMPSISVATTTVLEEEGLQEKDEMTVEEPLVAEFAIAEPLTSEPALTEPTVEDTDVCWLLIPNTPFALRYSLTWEPDKEEETKANVSAVECVTIEENDTVLIKYPSGKIDKGLMYVYKGEKKENDFVYVQNGRLLTADVRIYYKKAVLNPDGKTYSYKDALALLDFPTCSLCMND